MDPTERANLYVGTALEGWAVALRESDEAMDETQAESDYWLDVNDRKDRD